MEPGTMILIVTGIITLIVNVVQSIKIHGLQSECLECCELKIDDLDGTKK